MKISIIIPTYNEERYIEKTVKQFVPYKKICNIEVIVSDGKSKDNTIEIAKKYVDKIVIEKQKKNIASGRNFGAKYAKGEILMFIDADVIIPDKNKFFTSIKETFKNSKIVGATTKLEIYPEEKLFKDKFFHVLINFCIKWSLYLGGFLGKGECQIVRKKIWKKIGGYNENIVVGEDCNMFYRISKFGKIKYLKNLKVYHSPRRFRQVGYIKLLGLDYLKEGISLLLRGESYSEEWKPIR